MKLFTVYVSDKYVERFQSELGENGDLNFMVLGWERQDGVTDDDVSG